jgi:hypothetical protein
MLIPSKSTRFISWEVYCLGLGDINFNLPLFEIGKKSHNSAVQTILGFQSNTNIAVSSMKVAVSHSLLWGKSAVKKLYKDPSKNFQITFYSKKNNEKLQKYYFTIIVFQITKNLSLHRTVTLKITIF